MTTDRDATKTGTDHQSRSPQQTGARRFVLAIAATLALGYSLSALRAVYLAVTRSPLAPDQPGVFPMLAASGLALCIALAREAMSSQAHPLARQIGRACAYGWIVGVGMTMAITVVRLAPGAVRFDLGEISLNAFNSRGFPL